MNSAKPWDKYHDKRAVYQQNIRAERRGDPGRLDLQEWLALCIFYGNRCLACAEEVRLTIDHVIPVSRGGPNLIANIQPLCFPCNLKKSDGECDYRKGEMPIRIDSKTARLLQTLTRERRALRPDATENQIVQELIEREWSESHDAYALAAAGLGAEIAS